MSATGFDHSSFAEMLIRDYSMCFIEGVPAIWERGRYLLGIDNVNKMMIQEKQGITCRQRGEVMAYLNLMAPKKDMGNPNLISFNNGVLDIMKMELIENAPNLLIPNTIPHDYKEDAYNKELDDALNEWSCGDLAIRRNLEEVLGLSMYRGRSIPNCPVLVGEGGNGKSVFLNFVRQMLGNENCCALDLNNIGKQFVGSALMGKLANIGDDISDELVRSKIWAPAKRAISGDEIQAEIKYGPVFSFRPYCLFLFACNTFPLIDDRSNGALRRLVPIPFNADFSADSGRCDINLAELLACDEAYEYAIRLGIQALKGCLERGRMTSDDRQVAMKDELIIQNSPVYAFSRDALGFGTENEKPIEGIPTTVLYGEYVKYCKKNRIEPLYINKFTTEMCRLNKVKAGKKMANFPDGTRKQASVFLSSHVE